jgi:hypothetical protein
MLIMAVFGILAYPVNAIVVSLYMTLKLPRALLDNQLRILMRCHFLFGRWKPETCWFCNVTIFRNFLIAILPMVMPADQLDMTIVLMMLTLCSAMVLVIWFKPRRTRSQNLLDVFISYVQLIIVCLGLSSVHGSPVSEPLSAFLLILVALVVIVVVSLLLLKAFQLVHPSGEASSTYQVYVSHHAGAGGAAARVFTSMLERTVRTMFYDIDNLPNDTKLIDAIKISKNLVVILGNETLCRTWCIGAVVCAYRKKISMQSVVFDSPGASETVFGDDVLKKTYSRRSFTASSAKSELKSMVEVDTRSLRGHGVDQGFVQGSVRALLGINPVFMNFRDDRKVNDAMHQILDEVLQNRPASANAAMVDAAIALTFAGSGEAMDEGSRWNAPLIMIDHFDGEAVAVSRLLQSAFRLMGSPTWLEDQDIASKAFASMVRTGGTGVVAFIFSTHTLESASQLARWGLLTKCNPKVHVLPIVVGVVFDFPDDEYLSDLQIGKVLQLGSSPSDQLAVLAGDLVTLKNIADGMTYIMNFLVTFINVAQLRKKALNKVMAETLERALSKRGRRPSAVGIGNEGATVAGEAAPPADLDPPAAAAIPAVCEEDV